MDYSSFANTKIVTYTERDFRPKDADTIGTVTEFMLKLEEFVQFVLEA